MVNAALLTPFQMMTDVESFISADTREGAVNDRLGDGTIESAWQPGDAKGVKIESGRSHGEESPR